ncbi:thioredoxin domain-containing protein [Corynebacterium stationis]|uniref:thioredoxin domain-containing protein n=1 Tax=Corynebacterium stationis TaxID=1705 RepID=UPI00273BEC7A|nr:thioredoxin domain-containing protein [Corynebacterium stationis]WLP88221.1 thioredoxin domain-containing protein [Corynebacterium stationis]
MAKPVKVTDPNKKSGAGFLWGIVALLVIVAVVIIYIVVNGQRSRGAEIEDVAFNVSFEDNAVVLASDNATADTPEVDLYEDFSCPHCSDLSVDTGEDMKNAVEAGDLIVNIRQLNFLDGQDPTTNEGHSTMTVAAVTPLAEAGEAKAWWNVHKTLMADQQKVYNNWSAEDVANAAADAGASSEVVDEIKNSEISTGQEIATANYNLLEEQTGSVSSPRVIIDGEDIPEGELNNWVSYAVDNA